MNPVYPHLTPRQKAREIAFQYLYRLDGSRDPQSPPDAQETEKDFESHSRHFNCPDLVRDFATRLVSSVARNFGAIDSTIESHAQNWRLERIGAVERAFLRMGVAELLYFKDVPASVTLNEVIELSKYFGESDTPAFLNGILDPVSRSPEAIAGKVPSTP